MQKVVLHLGEGPLWGPKLIGHPDLDYKFEKKGLYILKVLLTKNMFQYVYTFVI